MYIEKQIGFLYNPSEREWKTFNVVNTIPVRHLLCHKRWHVVGSWSDVMVERFINSIDRNNTNTGIRDVLYYWEKMKSIESNTEISENELDNFLWKNDCYENKPESDRALDEIEVSKIKIDDMYFIKSNDVVKIGRSKDTKSRLQSLRTGIPYEPEIIHVEYGYGYLEKRFHEIFKKQRIRDNAEWFYYDKQLDIFITERKKQNNEDSYLRFLKFRKQA